MDNLFQVFHRGYFHLHHNLGKLPFGCNKPKIKIHGNIVFYQKEMLYQQNSKHQLYSLLASIETHSLPKITRLSYNIYFVILLI